MTDNKEPASLSKAQLQEVARKIRALRAYSRTSRFKTDRSQGTILGRLNSDDLAEVLMMLSDSPDVNRAETNEGFERIEGSSSHDHNK